MKQAVLYLAFADMLAGVTVLNYRHKDARRFLPVAGLAVIKSRG